MARSETVIAERNPPTMPEKHAWLEWDGINRPTAAGRPIPTSSVEAATINGYVWWKGWEGHIPLETGVVCVLWGPYCGWNDHFHRWQWTGPSLEPKVFVDDERERLCVRPITDIDGSVAFHTHRGCEGNDCMEFLRKAIDPWLYADEDLWMYLSEWSRYPVIREDERQEGTVTE